MTGNPLVPLQKALEVLGSGEFSYRQLDDLASKLYTSYVTYTFETESPQGVARFHLDSVGAAFRRMSLCVQMGSESYPGKRVNPGQLAVFASILAEAKEHMAQFLWYSQHDTWEALESRRSRPGELPMPVRALPPSD